MLLSRIKLFISRFLRARIFGITFFGARYFKIPKFIKFNNKVVKLNLPNEYGIKLTFVEIFLDDVYKLEWIKNFTKKNNIQIKSILDIGGNCGLASMLLRSEFPKSIIHCYEPNLEIQKYLEHNSNLGSFDYFSEAVGGTNEMVKLNIVNNSSTLSSIIPNETGTTAQISFDLAYRRFGVDTLDLVKMDCEGSEWEIFNNVENWRKVKFLTMEYHLGKNNFDHDRIVKVLDKIGFKLISKLEQSSKANYGVVIAYNTLKISI